jgi:hypothetical protein
VVHSRRAGHVSTPEHEHCILNMLTDTPGIKCRAADLAGSASGLGYGRTAERDCWRLTAPRHDSPTDTLGGGDEDLPGAAVARRSVSRPLDTTRVLALCSFAEFAGWPEKAVIDMSALRHREGLARSGLASGTPHDRVGNLTLASGRSRVRERVRRASMSSSVMPAALRGLPLCRCWRGFR